MTMDAGYKQPWIAKRIFEDGPAPPSFRTPALTAHAGKGFMPWDSSFGEEETTG